MIHIPSRDEFAEFLAAGESVDGAKLAKATLRDIARMIEIAHLVEEKFLSDDLVLSGGMAMRLRGSTRLTMLDADLSAAPRDDLTVDEVRDALELQTDQITIVPAAVESKVDLIKAFPVRFTFRRPPAPLGATDRVFKVDLAVRGLELLPDWVEFTHHYPFELGIEGTRVPIMALLEAVAEKAVGYGIYRAPKHYSDLAFAADMFHDELTADADVIHGIARTKFAANSERFSQLLERQQITDYASMKPSFTNNHYLRAVKYVWKTEIDYIGEAARNYSFPQAHRLVSERVVPILFP